MKGRKERIKTRPNFLRESATKKKSSRDLRGSVFFGVSTRPKVITRRTVKYHTLTFPFSIFFLFTGPRTELEHIVAVVKPFELVHLPLFTPDSDSDH